MAELHSRMEELEGLKDRMQAVVTSMAKVVSDGTSIINHNYPSFFIRTYTLVTYILT